MQKLSINNTTGQKSVIKTRSDMNKQNRQEMKDWINMKLKFINAIIKEAQMSHNYGKEIQYAGMREAYLEFLQKVNSEHFGEAAA